MVRTTTCDRIDVTTDDTDDDSDEPKAVTDGGRRPRSDYNHAPDVGPSDVDKCFECGRYAPHAFDHNPECSRFESIDDELSSRTAASNSRMVRPATDGGDSMFDKPPQEPEALVSSIAAATVGDEVAVYCSHDDTRSIYDGEVVSTGYKDHNAAEAGGTHVVAIDVAGDRVAVHFDRTIDFDADANISTPDPVMFDPVKGDRLPVTHFEAVDV